MLGGQAVYPTKDIVDNAVNSADHTEGMPSQHPETAAAMDTPTILPL